MVYRLPARLALMVVSLAISLAVVEVGLRWYAPQPMIFFDRGEIYRYDEELGYTLEPNATSRSGNIVINSHGLRDYEVPRRKPVGTFRILALG